MNLIDAVRVLLLTIAEAVGVQAIDNQVVSSRNIEKRFCLSLQATLESAIAWSSSDGGFSHDQELNVLLQAVLEPLLTVYDLLAPCLNKLRPDCEDDAYEGDIAQMELTLKRSVMEPITELRTQVHKFLPGINTLLLSFIMYVFAYWTQKAKLMQRYRSDGYISNRPPQEVSEQHFVEMQTLRQRAEIAALPDLDRIIKPFTIKTLTIEEQQQSLKAMGRDVQTHWQISEIAVHGIWSKSEMYLNWCVLTVMKAMLRLEGKPFFLRLGRQQKISRRAVVIVRTLDQLPALPVSIPP
jgi:hypothetical protein